MSGVARRLRYLGSTQLNSVLGISKAAACPVLVVGRTANDPLNVLGS